MFRRAADGEQVLEHLHHAAGRERPGDFDCQTLAGELVKDDEHPQLAALLGPVFDKVVAAEMVESQTPLPYTAILAASGGCAQSPTFPLLSVDLHPFLPPQSLDPRVINFPATFLPDVVNPGTPEARSPAGDPPHLRQVLGLVRTAMQDVTLRAPRQIKDPADTSLRNSVWPQATTHLGYRASSPLGAHPFGRAAT
jgi:hypothetical protein